jgi:hypothetical protein
MKSRFRFNIRWLILAVTICAIAAWWYAQYGTNVAHVIIIDNRLVLNDEGAVDGELQCQLVEANDYAFTYADFLCILNDVDQASLLNLKAQQRTRVQYRSYPVWPIAKADDPYRLFLNEKLNIPNQYILGAIRREDWMEIVIRGDGIIHAKPGGSAK